MWPDDFYDTINDLFRQADDAANKENRWLKWQVNRWIFPISVAEHNRRFDRLNRQINAGRDAATSFKQKLEERHYRLCQAYRNAVDRRFEEYFKKRDAKRLRHAKQCVLKINRVALAVGYPAKELKALCDTYFNKNVSTATMNEMVRSITKWLNENDDS